MSGSVLVVAHRGSSHRRPEHTLAAYVAAVEEGADALECDVRLTRDGHLVCVHDRRVNRTSDGRGVVSEKSLADLATLDFGSWHGGLPDAADELVAPDFDDDGADRRVLTLSRLLEFVVDAGRPVRLFVETKHPTRYGGLVEQQLVQVLRYFGLDRPDDRDGSPVVMMSFAAAAVRRVRTLAPGLPTMVLLDRLLAVRRSGRLPTGVVWSGPGLHVVRAVPDYVQRVKARGGRVYVWTVDEAPDIELVRSLGVDAIATNRPTEVLARLAGYG
ncbi:MAG: glycerophosphodiester phosphodiesterase [Actinobacteria bacterium]|nr:glycerophosphodiester phosphodiesterase [Actinomycetota bacterium]MBI3686276.1 glycerophosphodiester phosphodiesterase [Actinomycetota bacterium]